MENILFVTCNIPGRYDAPEYIKGMYFRKALTNVAKVFLLPFRHDWKRRVNKKVVDRLGAEIVFPRVNSSRYLAKLIFEKDLRTVVFSTLAVMREFLRLLPIFENVIVDETGSRRSRLNGTASEGHTVKILRSSLRKGQLHKASHIGLKFHQKTDFILACSHKEKSTLGSRLSGKKIIVIRETGKNAGRSGCIARLRFTIQKQAII